MSGDPEVTRFEVAVPEGAEARLVIVAQHIDPELIAIGLVDSALAGLDTAAQRRVVDWAWARWHGP